MHTVQGKVLLKETGEGIPDLVVAVYSIGSSEEAQAIVTLAADDSRSSIWKALGSDRLGSIITDKAGRFRLQYDPNCRGVRSGAAEIMVIVTVPEDSSSCECPEIIHVSCGRRPSAAPIESFLIRIPAGRLKAAGLDHIVPHAPSVEEIIDSLREKHRRDERLSDEMRKVVGEKIAGEMRRRQEVEEKFGAPDRLLSRFSQQARESSTYIAPGDDIPTRVDHVITTSVSEVHEKSTRSGLVSLTPAQQKRLQTGGQFRKDVRASTFNNVVFQRGEAPFDATRLSPFDYCRPQQNPDDMCTAPVVVRPVGPGLPAPTPHSDGGDGATFDLPRYIATLVGGMTSPEVSVRLESSKRADQAAVQSSINGLSLEGGPADVPATYDFHHLEIAFPYIWQEAFDNDTLALVRNAYDQVVGFTGVAPAGHSRSELEGLIVTLELIIAYAISIMPVQVSQVFDINPKQWMALSLDCRARLTLLASAYLQAIGATPSANWEDDPAVPYNRTQYANFVAGLATGVLMKADSPTARTTAQRLRQMGQQLIRYADTRLANNDKPQSFEGLHYLLDQLDERLREPYTFTHYASGSVNFGILATYRQVWQPLNYQAGELAKTITLAPKETRKFVKKVTFKTRRSEKEVRNNLQSRKDEASDTTRAESEIIRRASNKTNFNLNTESSFNVVLASGKVTTGTAVEASTASEEVKKDFREAVFKSTQEYKDERSLEVLSETSQDTEVEESGEITNPNDELPVTFLFYELQRRYRISEKIHRVRPVIFVAQPLPSPDQIDEAWLVAHDWILRRVILDDSFVPALAYLATKLTGDEFALAEMKKNLDLQRDMVDAMKEEVATFRAQAGQRYAALERSIQKRADAIEEEDTQGVFEDIGEFFGGSDESEEAIRIREEASKDAYERAAKEEKEVRARLETAITGLQAATEQYTKTLTEHVNRRAQISRLRVHVKENILYYMQAIWANEPPDQRFFRLQSIQAPRLTGELIYNLRNAPNAAPVFPNWAPPVHFDVQCRLDLPIQNASLAELADLDNLLGFKGNYMIFPLKKGNCLTDFMMAPYIDAALGLADPDEFGNWSIEEFADYVCCLKKHLNADAFAEIRDALRRVYRRLLSAPRRASEEIVIPTGSLFIEALPGTHPILEDFKLKHRAVDVKKAQSEVRKAELDNLRRAARLLDDDFEDPDIDKKIQIEGDQAVIVPE